MNSLIMPALQCNEGIILLHHPWRLLILCAARHFMSSLSLNKYSVSARDHQCQCEQLGQSPGPRHCALTCVYLEGEIQKHHGDGVSPVTQTNLNRQNASLEPHAGSDTQR